MEEVGASISQFMGKDILKGTKGYLKRYSNLEKLPSSVDFCSFAHFYFLNI